jgi:phosphoribosylformylglycinamidine synthase II
VVGIQDLGGAGLTCATSETASRGGLGMDVDASVVPRREPGMEAFEVMTSESQERMLAIVEPASLDAVLDICRRWEVRATAIGRVTPGPASGDETGGRLRIIDGSGGRGYDGPVLADVPASSLHEDAPAYDRPRRAPEGFDEAARTLAGPPLPASADPGAELLAMLEDHRWIWSQYDHQLFLNTVEGPGGDATVLRLKHPVTGADTGRALALTTDGNHRWCAVDPRHGAALTVAESVLNLATVGARPLCLVDCLNFGNPEHPEVMWQFSEAIDGLGDTCRALGIPIVGGNVSLYNESRGSDIDPTPVIGLLGMVDDLQRRPPGVTLVEGGRLVLVGVTQPELSGSLWARQHGHRGGRLPGLDLVHHTKVADAVRQLAVGGLLAGVHDVSSGGLGLALAEMAVRAGIGVNVARVADAAELFSESPSRAVLCVAPELLQNVLNVCDHLGVPTARIGVAGGERISVKGLLDVPLADAVAAWRDRVPAALGSGTTQG